MNYFHKRKKKAKWLMFLNEQERIAMFIELEEMLELRVRVRHKSV
jgi:hypothetical protein